MLREHFSDSCMAPKSLWPVMFPCTLPTYHAPLIHTYITLYIIKRDWNEPWNLDRSVCNQRFRSALPTATHVVSHPLSPYPLSRFCSLTSRRKPGDGSDVGFCLPTSRLWASWWLEQWWLQFTNIEGIHEARRLKWSRV